MWTTTPWTLVSNAAVAVHPELIYVRAQADGGPVYILAEELLERVLPDGADILASFAGSELEGVSYEPPFPFSPAASTAPGAIRCCWPNLSPLRTAPAWSTPRSRSARTTSGSASAMG